MIHRVSGDILLSKAQVIAHSVAPNDPMTQGLALSLRQKYPAMHKDYHHWCSQQHPKPGSAWMWGGSDGVRIVNLVTQEGGYGHGAKPERSTLPHVGHALRELKKMSAKEGFTSIAIPRIATGVGGLKWEEVSPLIDEHLGDLSLPVYVYAEYHPGQPSNEPR